MKKEQLELAAAITKGIKDARRGSVQNAAILLQEKCKSVNGDCLCCELCGTGCEKMRAPKLWKL